MNKLTTVFERMISRRRPHGGVDEGSALVYLARIAPKHAREVWVDAVGNLHIDMREHAGHRTLFVAHVDTVHRQDGPNPFTHDSTGFYRATKGSALGADDAAGIAILSVLMDSVPAYYVFCRGEEVGGVGSKFLAKAHADLLAQFDRAIAFDRRGYSDVITHQGCGRCASDAFGEALSDALNNEGLLYMPCEFGVYTDTAEFVDIIPECTNISCGYDFEHGDREQQDGSYLQDLCEAVLRVDWDALPVKREPGDDGYEPLSLFSKSWSGEAATNDDSCFPVASSPEEHDISEAVYMALEDEPRDLIAIVAKWLGVRSHQIDEELFIPSEVCAIAQDSSTWEEFIEMMGDECVACMPH